LVAKQAALVDLFSAGRTRLGFSVGWKRDEYRALGVDFHSRGPRFEEQVAVLRELWTKPAVTFRGDYHRIEGLGINPLPVQRPIPIWVGGFADAVLRRAAQIGDGWMATLPPDKFKASVTKLHAYLAQSGRDSNGFGISNHIYLAETPEGEWHNLLEEWRQLGVTHVEFSLMGAGLGTVDEYIAALLRFREAVGMWFEKEAAVCDPK
jgi:probable F420-dependent oxidoreductase